MALHVIDYFLLNSEALDIATHGFARLTMNEVKGFIVSIASSASVADSIYQWRQTLTIFLRGVTDGTDAARAKLLLQKYPYLAKGIPSEQQRILQLDDHEIVAARAWLMDHGYYKHATFDGYRFTLHTGKLMAAIYGSSTLRGHTKKPIPEELMLIPKIYYRRETDKAPVKTYDDQRMSEKKLAEYLNIIRSLKMVRAAGLPVANLAWDEVEYVRVAPALNLKQTGRTRTLPPQVVFSAVRNAIELFLDYGDYIVDAFLTLARRAHETGTTWATCSFYGVVPDSLRNLGVSQWSISSSGKTIEQSGYRRLQLGDHLQKLRKSPGLYELTVILYAAVQIVVGTVMARRASEVRGLVAGKCLDYTGTNLIFQARKQNAGELRAEDLRPIPEIAARMFRLLERLQNGLAAIGAIPHLTTVFSRPALLTTHLISVKDHVSFDRAVEMFCDFFEVAKDKDGRRHYIRTHQLRRFFPMLFFWNYDIGDLSVLSWFMDHSDPEQIWLYIKESCTGAVLDAARAQWAVWHMQSHAAATEVLEMLVVERFHTRNIAILDHQELEHYINNLLQEGGVAIDPIFFSTPDSKKYRIAVSISRLTEPTIV